MDYKIKWEDLLYLVKFAYKNGYQAYLGINTFEELYVHRCKTPLSWNNIKY